MQYKEFLFTHYQLIYWHYFKEDSSAYSSVQEIIVFYAENIFI